jgi:chromosome segregation ATPase
MPLLHTPHTETHTPYPYDTYKSDSHLIEIKAGLKGAATKARLAAEAQAETAERLATCQATLSECEAALLATSEQLASTREREARALSDIEEAAQRETALQESHDMFERQWGEECAKTESLEKELASTMKRVDQGCIFIDSLRGDLKTMTASKTSASEQVRWPKRNDAFYPTLYREPCAVHGVHYGKVLFTGFIWFMILFSNTGS